VAVTAPLRLFGGWLLLWCGLAWPAAAQRPDQPGFIEFDRGHTEFGFQLRTTWGQQVTGSFPEYDGEMVVMADGRHQVRIRLRTDAVQIDGSERYTQIARGENFFAAERYPLIEFVSEPHRVELVHDGGRLRGRLTMHGVSRMENFTLLPATCARPGVDCDVVARGSVDRNEYGLDGWQLLLRDRVRFTMRVRLAGAP
jgi:polyisoprenoid-binding protein YceI